MQNVWDLLIQNYNLIIDIVLVIVATVIMCIKKKPVKVVDSAKEIVLKLLPGLINSVEQSDLKGANKKDKVLLLLHECLVDLGYSQDCIALLDDFAKDQIEVILSTPQKKGN